MRESLSFPRSSQNLFIANIIRYYHRRAASPIHRICAFFNKLVKRRICPLTWGADMSMFHGVIMYVITMCLEVLFVSNTMLPKAPLPNKPFPVLQARRILIGGQCPPYNRFFSKSSLNQAPSFGIISFVGRALPARTYSLPISSGTITGAPLPQSIEYAPSLTNL